MDTQAENLEIPFTSTTYPAGFLALLIRSHPFDFVMQRRLSLPFLLVPAMTIDEEAEFGDDAADQEDVSGTWKKGFCSFHICFYDAYYINFLV